LTACALDHLALAVREWAQGGPVLAGRLGGKWLYGVRQPEFSPAQMLFGDAMRLELLEQGANATSFVRRFLDERGDRARPHHITFKVKDIDLTLKRLRCLGFEPILVNLDRDEWKEAFVHPLPTGLGFLVQVIQTVDDITDLVQKSPASVTQSPWRLVPGPMAALPFIAATVGNTSTARALLTGALGGTEVPADDGRLRLHWPDGADLVLEQADGRKSVGVHTVVFRVGSGEADHDLGHAIRQARFEPEIGVRVGLLA
jgi:catechol 2,3-dioxygenase-like lactoylglutathione lyase family enzyme